jgi:hypothetical protein
MSEELTQGQIEASNRRDLWREVCAGLSRARDSVEYVQGCLEDLDVYQPGASGFADQLDEVKDVLRRASNDAAEQVGRS